MGIRRDKPGPKARSGAMAEMLILDGGLKDDEIAARVNIMFPDSKMTKKTVQWYRWRLKRKGEISDL